MTIASTTNRVSYAGNGSTTSFAFSHPYRADSDLRVIVRTDATGAESLKTIITHYTIDGTADAGTGGFSGCNVDMATAPATGETLIIVRAVPATSALDPTGGSALGAANIEGAIDRAMLSIQASNDKLRRTLLQPETSPYLDLVLPEPKTSVSEFLLRVNTGGTAYELLDPSTASFAGPQGPTGPQGPAGSGGGAVTGTVGGTGDAMTLTPTPSHGSYAAGDQFLLAAPGANTVNNPTLNVSALGAQTIKSTRGLALNIPAYLTGDYLYLVYDGTDMMLISALTAGANVNAQTGTTYTVLTGDRNKLVTHSNTSAIAVTLPQANTTTFAGDWSYTTFNVNTGTVTITPTTSTINGAATLVLEQNQWARIISDGTNYRALVGGAPGRQTVWIPAGSMTTRTTNGAASATLESTTNKNMRKVLDFDQTTDEFAQFEIAMPKGWNEGTVSAEFIWECGVTGDVVWGLQAVAVSNDDLTDVAFGTAQTVTDSVTATTDTMISPETSAITIAGTPAEGDMVQFQVYRDADAGGDTAAGDARLRGVRLFLTYNALTDL